MCKVIFLLIIILFLPSTLWATDPIIGTWKLNMEKSKLPPIQANVQESSFTVRELGDDFELVATVIQKGGMSISVKYTWPQQGGFRKYEYGGPDEGIAIVETVVDSNNNFTKGNGYTTILLNGRQIALTQWILSKDGMTWHGIGKSSSAEGQIYEGLQWYEKQ